MDMSNLIYGKPIFQYHTNFFYNHKKDNQLFHCIIKRKKHDGKHIEFIFNILISLYYSVYNLQLELMKPSSGSLRETS